MHEHPWSARSWQLDEVKKLQSDPRVNVAYANLCQFGMTTHIDVKDGPRGPVAKPTGFMTSSWTMHEELSKKCHDGHQHVPLVGGRAAACQVYPPALCAAMCRGIVRQKAVDAGGTTTTGSKDRKQLMSLMDRIMNPIPGKRIRIHSASRPAGRPIGHWPECWVDNVHEFDGGEDVIGDKPRDGIAEMRN